MPQGYIFTKDELARNLQEANRDYYGRKTWEELYGNIALSGQQAISSLKQDYSSAIGEAYLSSLQSEQDILSSNIGQGYKERALLENEQALEEAFASYKQNYLTNVSSIQQSTAKATSQVTSALEQQADYTKQFAESHYQYLQYLYDEYSDSGLFKQDIWKRYLTDTGELKSWEELTTPTYETYTDEEGNVVKDWTSLFDDEGNLTIVGADFYDQMMNQLAYEGNVLKVGEDSYTLPTFGDWLSKENEELYEWSQSYNPYNYTEAGTQLGSFKTMVGLTSTDYKYQFIERYSGFTKKQLESKFDTFESKVEDIVTKMNKDDGDDTTSYMYDIKSLVSDVETVAKELGIYEDINFDEVRNTIQYYINNAENIDNEALEIYLGTTGTAAAMGAAAGSFLGPVGAGFGALIGGLIGAGIGTVGAAEADKKYTEARREYGIKAKNTYMNLITTMVQYSEQKRRQKQIDYYNNNK